MCFVVVFYAITVYYDTHKYVRNMFVPLVSTHGRRLLEDRGQHVLTSAEYETLTKAEWRNVHHGLETIDQYGNAKVPAHKLAVKTSLMTKFKDASLDSIYILLHKATNAIENCRSIALGDSHDVNLFTDSFVRCMNSRLT